MSALDTRQFRKQMKKLAADVSQLARRISVQELLALAHVIAPGTIGDTLHRRVLQTRHALSWTATDA